MSWWQDTKRPSLICLNVITIIETLLASRVLSCNRMCLNFPLKGKVCPSNNTKDNPEENSHSSSMSLRHWNSPDYLSGSLAILPRRQVFRPSSLYSSLGEIVFQAPLLPLRLILMQSREDRGRNQESGRSVQPRYQNGGAKFHSRMFVGCCCPTLPLSLVGYSTKLLINWWL